MSSSVQPSMFFLRLPDLKKLLCVTLTLQEEDEEPRSKQIKACRELVLLHSDILASPALDSFTEITVVLATSFLHRGILQVFAQRRRLQLGSPQCVLPGVLQCCLSYSLITRLTPNWNKAGLYLVSGKDFLTETRRLNAVSLELSTSEGQLCISIEANTVRLPPTTLQDFDLPPSVLQRFCSDPDSVLDPASTGGAVWCHVLPSMKKGQIITIRRKLPRDGPFRTYRDLQNHWNGLYGYRLPDLAEEEVVYCSVYFRLVGERLFTYPLSCIRLQPVQRCSRVDLRGALGSFLSDARSRLQSVCGFTARLSSKPRYNTVDLNTAAALQVLDGEQINLTTSSSTRPILTQLPPPPPPPPPPPRPVRPLSWSQPPAWTSRSHQDGAQRVLSDGGGFLSRLTRSQGCREAGDQSSSSFSFSSSSSSQVSFSFPDSSGYQSAPSLTSSSSSSSSSLLPLFQPASSLTSSSSSSSSSLLPLFQPASSLTSSSSSSSSLLPLFQPASSLTSSSPSSSISSSSSVLPPLPPPSQTPVVCAAPKLVPIFRNKCPSRHVNVALLRLQKQKEQLIGGGEDRGRLTLPAFKKKTPTAAPSSSPLSSFSAAPPPVPPPRAVPRFHPRPKPPSVAAPEPAAHQKLQHVSSLGPSLKPKPELVPDAKVEIKFKSKMKVRFSFDCNSAETSSSEAKEQARKQPAAAPPLTPSDISNKDSSTSSSTEGVVFESKPKKSRSAVRDVDVEKMARSNQLSRLNSAALLAWLKGRGVLVGAKHRKEDLMLKVMSCLAEA